VLDNYVPEIERSLKKTVAQVNARIGPARSLEVPSDFTVGTLCCREAYDLDPKGLVDAVVFVATEKLIEEQLDLSDSPLVEEAVLAVIAPLEGDINCTSFIEFRAAESVPAADNSAENALEQFEAPFWVNAPSGQAEEEWFSTEPTGSEGR